MQTLGQLGSTEAWFLCSDRVPLKPLASVVVVQAWGGGAWYLALVGTLPSRICSRTHAIGRCVLGMLLPPK